MNSKIAKHTIPFLADVAMAASAILLGGLIAGAQTKASPKSPVFEVASVRPSDPNDRKSAAMPRTWGDETGKVSLHHIPLNYVLMHVYNLQADQLSGPSWLADEFFDILATVPAGTPRERIPLMFQSLLEERFALKLHRETHTEKVLALVIGKGGPKLKEPLPDDPETEFDRPKTTGAVGAENRTVTTFIKTPSGTVKYVLAHGAYHYEYSSMTMEELARWLSKSKPPILGLSVVDETGLTGSYQVTLDYPAAIGPPVAGEASDPTGSILESLHKMGLDVMRREIQSERLVVDHIEKTPAPN